MFRAPTHEGLRRRPAVRIRGLLPGMPDRRPPRYLSRRWPPSRPAPRPSRGAGNRRSRRRGGRACTCCGPARCCCGATMGTRTCGIRFRLHPGDQALQDLLHGPHLPPGQPPPGDGEHPDTRGLRYATVLTRRPVVGVPRPRWLRAATIPPLPRCPTAGLLWYRARHRQGGHHHPQSPERHRVAQADHRPAHDRHSVLPAMFVAPKRKVFLRQLSPDQSLSGRDRDGPRTTVANRKVADQETRVGGVYAPGKTLLRGRRGPANGVGRGDRSQPASRRPRARCPQGMAFARRRPTPRSSPTAGACAP